MAEVVYHFRPEVSAAIDANRKKLLARRITGELTSDQVRIADAAFLAEKMRGEQARDESDEDRNVHVKCKNGCERMHLIPAKVERFKCPCTPYKEQLTALGRVHIPKEKPIV